MDALDELWEPDLGFEDLTWLRAAPQARSEPRVSVGRSCIRIQADDDYDEDHMYEQNKVKGAAFSGNREYGSFPTFRVDAHMRGNEVTFNGRFGDVFVSAQGEVPRYRPTTLAERAEAVQRKRLEVTQTPEPMGVNIRNAEACRKNRLKRKADEENLRKRNEELEENRGFFLERIAELQYQVDALQMAGSIDLRKENELLRIEISKHKAYLDDMVKAVKRHPKILLEERARLLKTCLDNSVAHVVGLAHRSTSWRHLHTTRRGEFSMRTHYDVYPKNVPFGEIKRINIRSELLNVPAPAGVFHKFVRTMWQDKERIRKFKEAMSSLNDVDWEIDEFRSPELDETLSCFPPEDQVQLALCTEMENNNVRLKTTMSACTAHQNLVPQALFGNDDSDPERERTLSDMPDVAIPVHIYTVTNCDEELVQAKIITGHTSSERFKVTNGHVVLPNEKDPNSCHVVAVSSIPIGHFLPLRTPHDMMTDDGVLTEKYINMLNAQLEFLAEEATAFCEATVYATSLE